MYVSVGAAAAEKAGLDLDPTFWPSAPAIRPHLRREVSAVQRTPHGLELTCRYSLPTGRANGPLGWSEAAPPWPIAFADCVPQDVVPLESNGAMKSGYPSDWIGQPVPLEANGTVKSRKVLPAPYVPPLPDGSSPKPAYGTTPVPAAGSGPWKQGR